MIGESASTAGGWQAAFDGAVVPAIRHTNHAHLLNIPASAEAAAAAIRRRAQVRARLRFQLRSALCTDSESSSQPSLRPLRAVPGRGGRPLAAQAEPDRLGGGGQGAGPGPRLSRPPPVRPAEQPGSSPLTRRSCLPGTACASSQGAPPFGAAARVAQPATPPAAPPPLMAACCFSRVTLDGTYL